MCYNGWAPLKSLESSCSWWDDGVSGTDELRSGNPSLSVRTTTTRTGGKMTNKTQDSTFGEQTITLRAKMGKKED